MNADDREQCSKMAEDVAVTRTKVEGIERRMEKGEKQFERLDRRVGNLERWRTGLAWVVAAGMLFFSWAAKFLPWKGGGG